MKKVFLRFKTFVNHEMYSMIDNIKITLRDFSGNLDNCKYIKEGKYDYFYFLSNSDSSKAARLLVRKNKVNGSLVISRSIRKWYFNKGSLLDLTAKSFKRVMEKLAKDLNISFEELCQGKITQCEIGQNVRVKVPIAEIIPYLVDYGHLERRQIENGTVYFNGRVKKLIVYDKVAEIAVRGIKAKKRALDILEEKGYHFLRIEFKLFYQKSFNQHNMGHISTVGDLIFNFFNLYEFWTHQINRIIVFPTIEKDIQNMTQKEQLIGDGLNHLGFEKFVEEYQSKCKSRTKHGLKSARSKAYKEVLDVLNKFGSKSKYGKDSLRADVARHLLRKSKQEDVCLPLLFQNLWGVK